MLCGLVRLTHLYLDLLPSHQILLIELELWLSLRSNFLKQIPKGLRSVL